MHTIKIANLYNSPPESLEISLSRRWPSSSSSMSFLEFPLVSFLAMISPTIPLTCLGIASTYWTLMEDLNSYSSIFVKYPCNSDPLKYFSNSFQSGGLSNLPKFGISFPARILRAVDLPIPFVPTKPRTYPALGVGSL